MRSERVFSTAGAHDPDQVDILVYLANIKKLILADRLWGLLLLLSSVKVVTSLFALCSSDSV